MIHKIDNQLVRLVTLLGAGIVTACAAQTPVPPPSPTISATTPAAATATAPPPSPAPATTVTATPLPQPQATEPAATTVTLLVSNAAGKSVSFVDPQRGVLAQVEASAAP